MMGGVAVAALLGAVGCSDSTDVATGPRYRAGAPTTSSCNITTTKADARAYFPNGVQTTAQAMIKTLGDQFAAGNTTGATSTGFDIMKLVADAHRNGTAAGTALDGSNLTNDLIGCMDVGAVTLPIDFTAALGAQGGYEVRGGSADAVTPVGALGKKSALQAPAATAASWKTWVDGRVLFYGAPISNSFVTEQPVGTRGYNWSTVPVRHTLIGDGLVAVCVAATDRDRLEKKDEVGIGILTVQDFTPLITAGVLDCSTSLASAPATGLLPRLAALALRVVTPEPLYAAKSGGGTGGTLNGLSDIGVLDAGRVNLTMSFINDATVTTALGDITVTAKGNGGTVLPNVTVQLLISGNNGSYTPITTSRVTDVNGVATFSGIIIDKAGGYTLEASSSFSGYDPSASFSNLFHIKNQ
jgi:hypothetical protein